MMAVDYEYAVQTLAWAVVWSAAGLTVRQWLSGRDDTKREHQR